LAESIASAGLVNVILTEGKDRPALVQPQPILPFGQDDTDGLTTSTKLANANPKPSTDSG
jgi:hypothetical protein